MKQIGIISVILFIFCIMAAPEFSGTRQTLANFAVEAGGTDDRESEVHKTLDSDSEASFNATTGTMIQGST